MKAPAELAAMNLGEILRHFDLVTDEQAKLALEQQRVSGEKFGEVLVRLRILSPADIDRALELQKQLRSKKPEGAVREILNAAKKRTTSRLDAIDARLVPRPA